MAEYIVRTNPNKNKVGTWDCSQCRKPYVDFDKAKACAEKDFKRRTGRNPKKSHA